MGVLGINLDVAIVVLDSVINLYEILKRLDVTVYKSRRERRDPSTQPNLETPTQP